MNSSKGSQPSDRNKPYLFDVIIGGNATQEEVYEACARAQIDDFLSSSSQHSCFLTYGQTCSGKTHTLLGDYSHKDSPNAGILPRAIAHLFNYVNAHEEEQIRVKSSGVELYCFAIYDLMNPF